MTDDHPALSEPPAPIPPAATSPAAAFPAAPVQGETHGERRALLATVAVLALLAVVGGVLLWRAEADNAAELAALNTRIAQLEARPVTDPAPLDRRIDALTQRVGALETKPPPQATLDAAAQKQFAELAGRVDALAARQDQIGTQQRTDAMKLDDQLGQIRQQVAEASKANAALAAETQKASSDVAAAAARQGQIVRIQAATVALAAGRPLGDLPGAPPALAQFATKPPPTQAALRLSYDEAAQHALAAGQPSKPGTSFLTRLWDRAQSGIVVREGDRVLVGDTTSDTLEKARRQLDAGDLAGTVSSLGELAGPAAQAMAGWRAQAQSLLDARAALLAMANR